MGQNMGYMPEIIPGHPGYMRMGQIAIGTQRAGQAAAARVSAQAQRRIVTPTRGPVISRGRGMMPTRGRRAPVISRGRRGGRLMPRMPPRPRGGGGRRGAPAYSPPAGGRRGIDPGTIRRQGASLSPTVGPGFGPGGLGPGALSPGDTNIAPVYEPPFPTGPVTVDPDPGYPGYYPDPEDPQIPDDSITPPPQETPGTTPAFPQYQYCTRS